MLSSIQRAEVVKNNTIPPTWSVELVDSDGDGGVDVTIFSGPDAEARATEYTRWKYAHQDAETSG
jgi:hypothetical protein